MDTTWLDDYRSLSAEEAKALAHQQGRSVRVLRPDDPITADFSAQRLNIMLADDGSLIGFKAS
jgi:Peptidase inhibitor I78 family